MNMFDQYFSLQEEILNYFGFKDKTTLFTIDDRRDWYWSIIDDSVVEYGEKNDIDNNNREDLYRDNILKDGHCEKSIYVGQEYTMIIIDTEKDVNNFLAIYDNSKEIK